MLERAQEKKAPPTQRTNEAKEETPTQRKLMLVAQAFNPLSQVKVKSRLQSFPGSFCIFFQMNNETTRSHTLQKRIKDILFFRFIARVIYPYIRRCVCACECKLVALKQNEFVSINYSFRIWSSPHWQLSSCLLAFR